MEKIK